MRQKSNYKKQPKSAYKQQQKNSYKKQQTSAYKQQQEDSYKQQQKLVKKEFLKLQNKCYLCGQSLNTHVENLPESHLIVERAQCQNCMTMVRVKNHPLQ